MIDIFSLNVTFSYISCKYIYHWHQCHRLIVPSVDLGHHQIYNLMSDRLFFVVGLCGIMRFFSTSLLQNLMLQRLLNTTTKKSLPQSVSTITPRQQNVALFGTSSAQWFRRFLSPKEEKQLYMGITALFREKLKEKSTPSNQLYSNMIDQVILGTKSTVSTSTTASNYTGGFDNTPATPLTLQQLGQLKHDLDAAGKAKDLAQLETIWQQTEISD